MNTIIQIIQKIGLHIEKGFILSLQNDFRICVSTVNLLLTFFFSFRHSFSGRVRQIAKVSQKPLINLTPNTEKWQRTEKN